MRVTVNIAWRIIDWVSPLLIWIMAARYQNHAGHLVLWPFCRDVRPMIKQNQSQSRKQNPWGQHGARLGLVGPRWAPWWPHEPCYQGNHRNHAEVIHPGPVSISEKTSFRKISLSLEVARFVSRIVRSLWNLTGTSAALLPMCLSNFKAIGQFKVPISWLRDFTKSYEKTSFRILRRGPGRPNSSRWCSIRLRSANSLTAPYIDKYIYI